MGGQASPETVYGSSMGPHSAHADPRVHGRHVSHRPTCTIRTRRRADQCTTACSCKSVPDRDRISLHNTHESPGWIREMTRAQAAARVSWSHDDSARDTSMHMAPDKRVHPCFLASQAMPLHVCCALAQIVRPNRAPRGCRRISAVAPPRCRSSR